MLSVPNRGKRSAKYSKANSKRNSYLQKYFRAQNRPQEGRESVLASPIIPRTALLVVSYDVYDRESLGSRGRSPSRANRLTVNPCSPSLDSHMKPEGPAKHFILAFVLALAGYVVCYQIIEHRRTRNGPWQVAFTAGAQGVPAIVINQPKLGITNVQIRFAELPPLEPALETDGPLSTPRGERMPKAEEEAAQGLKARIPSGNSLPATNSPVTLVFNQPKPVPYEVPFGNCVFMDTTFLPGTITFQFFGHEIELLPRVLVIDRQEHSWRPDTTIALPRVQTTPARAKP